MDCMRVVIICVLLLSATQIQGFAAPRGSRCKCKTVSNHLVGKHVTKLDIYPPSSKCASEENIVTIKKGKTKCVHPNNKELQAIRNGTHKNIKNIQVNMRTK